MTADRISCKYLGQTQIFTKPRSYLQAQEHQGFHP